MNKIILPVLFFVAIAIACSKNNSSTSNAVHRVTYKLTANSYTPFGSIIYVDTTYTLVQGSAVDSTNGWSKTYLVLTPFNAQLSVQGINSTTSTLKYTLEIDEDGAVKSQLQDSVLKFNSFSNQIGAAIQ